MSEVKFCTAEEFKKRLASEKGLQVFDVREAFEYESGHLPESILKPYSEIKQWAPAMDKTKPVYLVCKSGARAGNAARELAAQGVCEAVVVEGGMNALEGKACAIRKQGVWDIDRQVRCVAGALILIGFLLAWKVHPGFLSIPVFVGLGLFLSALTNFCGMAILLAKMPWNQVKSKRGVS
ncbi:MAG: rhodanese-like domain-containing protein [Candidatus Omnitrophica bacterium]|nr:rhodanese-like domain-containing protein [Candidatus Omnitrophota bacterium]